VKRVNAIDPSALQAELDRRSGRPQFLHLETTTGSYTLLGPEKRPPVIAFVRNVQVVYQRGSVRGSGPYRVGLKLEHGWVYADGLTDMTVSDRGELLIAGHDPDGQLTIALQLSEAPFREA
jgi:hypothetical protein